MTQNQFNAGMSALDQSLRQLIFQSESQPVVSGAGAPLSAEAFAPSQAIDQLNNVTITNANLTASEIPNLSGSYLSLGGGTLTGAFIDSGTATSSLAGALGIGTTSPSDVLAVNGPVFLGNVSPTATSNRLYSTAGSLYWNGAAIGGGSVGNWTSDGTNVWRSGGNVGIGTTSPSSSLSVSGSGYITGGLGVGALNTTAGTLITSGNAIIGGPLALTSSSTSTLTDMQGTSQYMFSSWGARLWELADGTSLNPVTTAGSTFKISRTEAVASSTCNNNNTDNGCNAALLVESNSAAAAASSSMQTDAIKANAAGEPAGTNASVVGINAVGDIIGTGTGFGSGAYLEGRRDTATGKAHGAEVRVSNITNTPGTYNPGGVSDTEGLWITTNSSVPGIPSGAGISFGGSGINGSQFMTGIGFTSGSIANDSIEDDSSATTSIDIKGSHAAALLVEPGAGNVGIGTTSPSRLLDVSTSGSGTTLANAGNAAISITNTNTTNNNFGELAFLTVSNTGATVPGAKITGVFTNHATSVSSDLAFLTRANGSLAESMRITGAGNVGIGTTTPWSDVANATSLLDLTSNGVARLVMHDTGTTQEETLSSDGTGFYIDSAGSASVQ